MPDFDAAGSQLPVAGDGGTEGRLVGHFVGCRKQRRPVIDDGRQVAREVGVDRRDRFVDEVGVEEHRALAGLGEDVELIAHVAANGACVGTHRNAGQAHAIEGAKVGDEHALERGSRAGLVEVEGVGVLHQELARAHGAEAGPHLVTELPLDVVEVERQILV
jgi:hypothetical protein